MNTHTIAPLLVLACMALASCVVCDYPGGHPGGSPISGHGVYRSLPRNYVGETYLHQNRYYYGGNYERGVFTNQGRQYTDRYYHGGQYYYGGRNEHHGSQPGRYGDDSRNRSGGHSYR